MLEDDYQEQLNRLLGALTSQVVIPDEWTDYFSQSGFCTGSFDEQRRFPRKYFRQEVLLEIDQTLPAIERQHSYFAVFTRDVSKNSIGFLHTHQLFPREKPVLWLPEKKQPVIVTRCSRHNDHCYSIGAIFGDQTANGSDRYVRQVV